MIPRRLALRSARADRAILVATDLEPAALVLDVTESLMLEASVASDGPLSQLREMGVQRVADDFGTGLSALEYFKRFRVHRLKIDRSRLPSTWSACERSVARRPRGSCFDGFEAVLYFETATQHVAGTA